MVYDHIQRIEYYDLCTRTHFELFPKEFVSTLQLNHSEVLLMKMSEGIKSLHGFFKSRPKCSILLSYGDNSDDRIYLNVSHDIQ